jgi:TolB-like protein
VTGNQSGFITELRRRNVFRVAAAFLAAAWLVLQLVDVLNDILTLPEWFGRLVLIGLLVAFPIALILAWAFEITPDGLKRESDVDRSQPSASQSGRKLDFIIIGVLAIALTISLYANFASTGGPIESIETTADEALSIAVLPFANRSAREDDIYFVDGVHDDILTQLAKIHSLTVTSRTSVERFRDPSAHGGVREIAATLGVRNILEGGVQRAGDRIRINVQLIDVTDDTHLWAESYDREMTASNIFAVQGEIATAVADALRVVLEAEEEQALRETPTENLAAYDLYLAGRHQWYQRTDESIQRAKQYFEQAIAEDPEYVPALAGLADSYMLLAGYGNLDGAEAYPLAQEAIDKAMAMDDAVSEVWTSLAYLRALQGDPSESERAFRRALELDERNATAWQWYSILLERTRRFEESLLALENAYALEPMIRPITLGLANRYANKGDFIRARQSYERLAMLDETQAVWATIKVGDMYFDEGRIAKAISWWRDALDQSPSNQEALQSVGFGYTVLGDYKEARRWFLHSENMNRDSMSMIVLFEAEQDYDGGVVYLEDKLTRAQTRQLYPALSSLFRVSYLSGDYAQAAEYLAELLAMFNGRFEVDASEFSQMHILLRASFLIRYGEEFGLDAAHGHELVDDALAALLELRKHNMQRPITFASLATAYALKGNESMAIANLAEAVDRGLHRYPYALNQPVYDDLRGNSEFEALEDRIEMRMEEELAELAKIEFAAYTPPQARQPIAMSHDEIDKFLGYFTDGNILLHAYIAEDGSYMGQLGQFPPIAMLPYEEFKFFSPQQPDITAEFFADENGEITHVLAGPTDQQTRMKRFADPPPAIELPRGLLDLYKGSYVHARLSGAAENRNESDLWVAELGEDSDGRIMIDFDDQPALEIVPTSETEFYIRGFDSLLTMFVNEDTGQVEGMEFIQDGRPMAFERQ